MGWDEVDGALLPAPHAAAPVAAADAKKLDTFDD